MLIFFVAAEEGFEPSQTESESVVLPLHNSAISLTDLNMITENLSNVKHFFIILENLFLPFHLCRAVKQIFAVIKLRIYNYLVREAL